MENAFPSCMENTFTYRIENMFTNPIENTFMNPMENTFTNYMENMLTNHTCETLTNHTWDAFTNHISDSLTNHTWDSLTSHQSDTFTNYIDDTFTNIIPQINVSNTIVVDKNTGIDNDESDSDSCEAIQDTTNRNDTDDENSYILLALFAEFFAGYFPSNYSYMIQRLIKLPPYYTYEGFKI
ncbi:20447_t:CDS:2 [Dentiscutata erythropus]|uniref:20447_t:CDS:1 n=1 Tax=Dentiscutata erythropus TaxID=1348616 RepID=A0A9N9GYP5_9GLOM|nr:20447_t:CDS:2 [Dentiscutata erythropus]